MRNIHIVGILLVCITVFLPSCFDKDERMPPQPPSEAVDIALQNSIYDNQVYFDFGTGEIKADLPNDSWVMAFDASESGWQVNINSGNLYAVIPTGVFSFDSVTPVTTASLYHFDAIDGNPDSCAFSPWLNREVYPARPTGEIFLIGQYDGIKYTPLWKVRIDSVNSGSFTLSCAGIDGEPKSSIINKDPDFNFVYVNVVADTIKPVNIEPPKTDWDILFSQYGTILYTDEGVPTPYYVRGVLLNPYKVSSALDNTMPFDTITWDDVRNLNYDTTLNFIGYDWKEVIIDFNSNSAEYYVRKDSTWIIRDMEDRYFKMHFLNYYNSLHQVGYPEFEYLEL